MALARALAPRPPILLMDEPFSGLDNRLRDGIRDETLDILKEEGTAVLLVTHEPDEAMRMADRDRADARRAHRAGGGALQHLQQPGRPGGGEFFSDVNVIHGVVQNFATDTPFGRFLTPGLADRADVEIIIRPQHLKMDFDRNGAGPLPTSSDGVPARGRVERARFVGNQSIVELAMDHDGSVLKATIPGVFLPKAGHAALAVAAPRPLLRLSLPGAERGHEPVFGLKSPRRAAVWGLRAPAGRHITDRSSGGAPPGRLGR